MQKKLPVFGVEGKLEYYTTTEQDRIEKHAKGLPPQECRLLDEEETIAEVLQVETVSLTFNIHK